MVLYPSHAETSVWYRLTPVMNDLLDILSDLRFSTFIKAQDWSVSSPLRFKKHAISPNQWSQLPITDDRNAKPRVIIIIMMITIIIIIIIHFIKARDRNRFLDQSNAAFVQS